MELRFWIPIVSGIPDSLSCISDSKAQDSRFRNPDYIKSADVHDAGRLKQGKLVFIPSPWALTHIRTSSLLVSWGWDGVGAKK